MIAHHEHGRDGKDGTERTGKTQGAVKWQGDAKWVYI